MKADYMVLEYQHFFQVKVFKPLGILFILKLYARVGIFTKIICI